MNNKRAEGKRQGSQRKHPRVATRPKYGMVLNQAHAQAGSHLPLPPPTGHVFFVTQNTTLRLTSFSLTAMCLGLVTPVV